MSRAAPPSASSRRLSLVVLLVVTLALTSTSGVTGVEAHDPSEELEQVRREMAALEDRIAAARAQGAEVAGQLSAARERVEAALAAVAEAQGRVDAVKAEIAAQEAHLAELTAHIEQVTSELAATQAKLAETHRRLQVYAVEMYVNASGAMASFLLQLSGPEDLAVGLAYADGVLGEGEDLIDAYETLRREEERQREALEARKKESEQVLATLQERRASLEADLAEVEAQRAAAEQELASARNLLADINRQIAAAEQHREGLEADARRLEAEIRARQQAGGSKPGALAWPVNGRVSSPFGYRVHPIFGTRRLHTGIDIAAGSGTAIKAAEAGTVILSGPYGGYGNAVVIDHGGGLSTLYAHQSRIAVSRGTKVSRGQVVGYVGCTGFCTGPHLHFETRENGTPVDPMRYLR